MPLDAAQLALLSRLLDEALALPTHERDAWLQRLPPEAEALRARLQRALQAEPDTARAPRFDAPQLPPEPGGDGQEGERVGPWRLLQLLGQGGMGSVWAAERADGHYQRQVALKLPRLARSPTLAQRMAQEAQIAARLEHPGIARLYDAGVDERGRPYLVMERVQGSGLAEHAHARGLGWQARVRLVLQAADALAHAHRLLVVHRDIKPSNLMVDEAGQVKLLDFGVARLLDDAVGAGSSVTLSDGARTHTPLYAAPEQRTGGAVGTATDLYALALVLHELLAGTLPMQADAATAPQPNPALDPGLRAVLHRAWKPEPAQRQPSVAHFADELRAVLAQRVPASWPASPGQRLRLWSRRHRVALTWGSLALAASAVGLTLLLVEQARGREQQARLDQARVFMFQTLWDALPAGGAAPGTAAPHVQRALARARSELGAQPVLQAEVFNEIAVLLRNLGQEAEALALLEQAHAQMQRHADDRDPGRAIVAAQLATQLIADGGAAATGRAEALARHAIAGCDGHPRRCAMARAYAQWVLAQRAAGQGQDATALTAMRASLAEHEAAFGPEHPYTTLLRLELAVILRNGSQLQAALDELQRADAAAQRQPLSPPEEARRATLHAVLLADLGRHGEALARVQGVVNAASPEAPESPATLLARRLRAQSLYAWGLFAAAADAADQALAAASRVADAWEGQAARQVQVLAAGALQRPADSTRGLEDLQARLSAQSLGPASGPGRAELRARAEIALRDGRGAQAQALLQAQLGAADPVLPPLERGRALELLAAARRVQGQPAEALALHREAATLWAAHLPADHPTRLRNAFEAAWAATLADPPADRAALRSAGQAWAAALPDASAWQPLISRIGADPEGTRRLVL